MLMKHHIFLSYSRKDIDLMRRLRADLQALGFTVWTDEGIDPGTPLWDEAIENALKNAGCMVVILTPNAINAKGLRDEIHYANIHDVRIFPVLAEGDAKTSVPYRLSGTQWTDIRTDYDVGLTQLQNAVNKHITPVGALNLTPASPASAEISAPAESQSPQILLPDLSQILPQPFNWCPIPAGEVTVTTYRGQVKNYIPEDEPRTFEVPAFTIAKYPVTNAQFTRFIEADGYQNRDYWTKAGWQARQKEGWTQPRFWLDSHWNQPDYPVVGVSWYEAVAFCNWLNSLPMYGEGTKGRGLITLPTEQQWQRAAQGDDNRVYPWGNDFDQSHSNTEENGFRQTTLVTQYPDGASPYGVMDMSGNVWEWCLTAWDDGSDNLNGDARRCLRGGSWNLNHRYARVTSRFNLGPNSADFDRGFRLCVVST